MSTNTITQQGFFTSTGNATYIPLRSGVDWMRVYNTTVAEANQTTAIGVEYYWQFGFPAGAQWEYLKSNAANAANLSQYLSSGGFTYYDSSLTNYGVINSTITAISTGGTPVVTNTGNNGIIAGQVVRILNQAGAPQLGSIDFTVGLNTLSSTTFSLDFMGSISVAGTTGSWMLVNSSPLFYPSHRVISAIPVLGSTTQVYFTVRHNYQVGQILRFNIPANCGMVQLNGMAGTIISIGNTGIDNYVIVAIDSSSFTVFAFPTAANYPSDYPSVTPVGEDTAYALSANENILSDATVNTGTIGMMLAAGANSPAGQEDNVIFWQAGSVFANDVQPLS